ncbi:MAG: alkaline phosphatase D family protein [bacterium]|nr:alkaline phosphatase D family protein [bacterium]
MSTLDAVSRLALTRPVSRRGFLRASAAASALAGLGWLPGPRAFAGTGSLFALGVASGDPAMRSVVLWTRLGRDPLAENGGMTAARVPVRWEVALDESFTRVVRKGKVLATAAGGYAVHAIPAGLRPDTWYFYRFIAEGETSRVGRTRTMPARNAAPGQLRFALVSCQDYQNGYFAAYRDIAEQDLDLVVHVGDYIYEYGANATAVRQHVGGETQTLADYRQRHALYKLDPQLQEAHARFPFLVTWDDHEVQNNYAGPFSETGIEAKAWAARRAAAYRAYWEHMPLRPSARPKKNGMTLYRQLDFGPLARIFMLDGRQYRTDQPCDAPSLDIAPTCPGDSSPDGTFLGARQEKFLLRGLERSRATWNVLAQQVMMMRGDLADAFGSSVPVFNMDAWDGYQAQRQRLLDFLARGKAANPIVLTGDIHSAWAADLKQDFLDPASPAVAAEFVTSSITSDFPAVFVDLIEANLGPNSKNPHIYYFDGRKHGYVRCTVTPGLWRSDYRTVESILDPNAAAQTAASWVVEAGVPGTKPA